MQHQLEHRLDRAPGVPAYLITIKANDGTVTLTGAVNDLLAKIRADQVAQTVPGVTAVRNEIEVRPTARTAYSIRRGIEDTLSEARALSNDQIYTQVHDGFVTLTGTVESWPEQHLAGLLAESVPGVRGIDNKLRVAYDMPRCDADIKADIQSRLRWDPWLNTPELKVTVSGGKVRMQGFVANDSAREHVYRDSWVNGAKSVSISRVEVVPNVRVAMNEAGLAGGAALAATSRLPDAELQTDIAKACGHDPLLKRDHLKVQVKNGVVSLCGAVPSREARQAAQEIAQDFVAAGNVQDLIRVEPSRTS